jgi:uncharacterized protein (TIGR04255 family)
MGEMTYPHLSRAPIAEALLDFRVEHRAGVSLGDIAAFGESIQTTFPDARTIRAQQFEVTFSDASPVGRSASNEIGKIYWNREASRAAQATLQSEDGQPGGFTVNWTRDYQDFDSLVEMARPLWQAYCEYIHPLQATRCALRYVNKIGCGSFTTRSTGGISIT